MTFIFGVYMLDDATVQKGVTKHSCGLQPSINLHAPVTAFKVGCSGQIGKRLISYII